MSRLLTSTVLIMTVVFAGCTSSTAPTTQASMDPSKKIVVSTNAGNVEVFVPTGDPDNPIIYCSTADGKVCPQCKADAIKYFKTGVLEPKCSVCGATRMAVPAYTGPGHSVN